MRCGCANCDSFMVNDDGRRMGCACPECGYRCDACLGTNTVIDRDALESFRSIAEKIEKRHDNTRWSE